MLSPVGPLQPAVYWRRRAIALVGLIVALVLIFWGAAQIGSAGSGTPANAASSASASSAGSSSSASSYPSSSTPAAAGSSSTADGPAPASETAAPSGSTAPSGSAPSGSAPDSSSAAPSGAVAPAPAAPVACTPDQLEVQVANDKPAYVAGDKPQLVLTVVNTSAVPCIRDLNAAGQEMLIFDAAGNRVWSSNDCYPESSNDTKTLAAGQKVDYTVIWSGKVSEPTCTAPRPLLGPGAYVVQAVQSEIQSAPGQIVLQ